MMALLQRLYDEIDDYFGKTLDRLKAANKGQLAENLKNCKYSVFYSNPLSTLTKGDIYFLGLNPGGSPLGDGKEYAYEKVSDFQARDPYWNAYADEIWSPAGKNRGVGQAPLQRRVQLFLESLQHELRLKPDMRSVFACNLCFFRSNTDSELREYGDREFSEFFRNWHKQFLSIVKPKVIVCNGNSKDISAFNAVKSWFNGFELSLSSPVLYSTFTLKSYIIADYSFKKDNVLVLGLPHLSRFSYEAKKLEVDDYIRKAMAELNARNCER